MTPEQLDTQWQLAQDHEAAGDLDAARRVYAELISASPRQVMVQVRLSEIEQKVGRYRASHAWAMQAAKTIATTSRWEGLPFVTARLLEFDERSMVLQLIGMAEWSDARIIRQSPVLSQQLWLCGDPEGALRLIDIAEKRVPNEHRLAYSKGVALQHLGRLQEAANSFERCIELAPYFALAHLSLAYHAPAVPRESRNERVLRAIGQQDDRFNIAMLHYAMYKELDDADRCADAWMHLESGSEIMRDILGRRASGFSAAIDAVQSAYAGEIVPSARAESSSRVPVFIVGMPRTGTTLLERILGGHAQVADAGEINALQHAISDALDKFVDFPLSPDDVATAKLADMAGIGEAYMHKTGWAYGNATHLIDKNPLNFFAADVIARALPAAKILCMVRGGMDACYSNYRQIFQNGAFAYSYDQKQLAKHYASFRRMVGILQQRMPNNFLIVQYERLVENPIEMSRQVMDFCGLAFDPACIDITANASPSSTASSVQIRQPIHTSANGQWKRYEAQLQPLLLELQKCLSMPDAIPH